MFDVYRGVNAGRLPGDAAHADSSTQVACVLALPACMHFAVCGASLNLMPLLSVCASLL
jgi:hypothetical protein